MAAGGVPPRRCAEPATQLIHDPLHPYTQALLTAVPEANPDLTRNKEKVKLRSMDVPSLLHLPGGCTLHPRGPLFEEGLCDVVRPELVAVGARRAVACHVVARALTGATATSVAGATPANPSGTSEVAR